MGQLDSSAPSAVVMPDVGTTDGSRENEQEDVPPAAIGLRKGLLAIKLQWWKHMAGGSRIVRRLEWGWNAHAVTL